MKISGNHFCQKGREPMCFTFPQMPEKLTAAEKTIMEYMIGHKEEFIFMSIGQLANTLNVSDATISRFARHLGCEDFKHLKQVVMEQTVQKGPVQKIANTIRTGNGQFMETWIEQQQYNLKKTMELLEGLAPVRGEDLVILFGFSKISAEGSIILEYQKSAGYQTLLFTGQFYQEEEKQADIKLFVFRGEENEYHSMSAPAAVVDALVVSVSSQLGAKAVENLDNVRKLKEKYSKKM